jgi:hypothetical protein
MIEYLHSFIEQHPNIKKPIYFILPFFHFEKDFDTFSSEFRKLFVDVKSFKFYMWNFKKNENLNSEIENFDISLVLIGL